MKTGIENLIGDTEAFLAIDTASPEEQLFFEKVLAFAFQYRDKEINDLMESCLHIRKQNESHPLPEKSRSFAKCLESLFSALKKILYE